MHCDKLLKLAAYLRNVPPEKFDMEVWGMASKPVCREPVCATRACALGWATTIPEFARLGLELRAFDYGGRIASVRYQGALGTEAAEKFFDIPYLVSRWLFVYGADTTDAKANQIEQCVYVYKAAFIRSDSKGHATNAVQSYARNLLRNLA